MITKLPNGLDTVVGDQGKQLSGGQKLNMFSFAREFCEINLIRNWSDVLSIIGLYQKG